jgi:hypothetical protein
MQLKRHIAKKVKVKVADWDVTMSTMAPQHLA